MLNTVWNLVCNWIWCVWFWAWKVTIFLIWYETWKVTKNCYKWYKSWVIKRILYMACDSIATLYLLQSSYHLVNIASNVFQIYVFIKAEFRCFFLLFMASIRSQQPGPTLVPEVFRILSHQLLLHQFPDLEKVVEPGNLVPRKYSGCKKIFSPNPALCRKWSFVSQITH